MREHHVTVRLRYTNGGATRWKWCGACSGCSWGCMSWAWRREDGSGALSMAFDHIAQVTPSVAGGW